MADTAEHKRIQDNNEAPHGWATWGAYVSERQWGTVREDYSPDGSAWDYFPHDHARSRAYRWGEDGLFGWSDRNGFLNISLAVWNGKDPILKERLFGLTNSEGNHGEDVKELYFYLEAAPTQSYMRGSYIYPIQEYPYEDLLKTNKSRSKLEPEYELIDTGILEHGWFDVQVEFAKSTPYETAIRYTVENHSSEAATIHLVPQACFRNTWSWEPNQERPQFSISKSGRIECPVPYLGDYHLLFEGEPDLLFTENETNAERLFNTKNNSPFVKDAFHRRIVENDAEATNPIQLGSKFAAWYKLDLKPGEKRVVRALLTNTSVLKLDPKVIDSLFDSRKADLDAFYSEISPNLPEDVCLVFRQSLAGLIWSKQFYRYNVSQWLDGDPLQPPPHRIPSNQRNVHWRNFNANAVMSMPDKWEYPWFASWDLMFQCIAFSLVDPDFAKSQLILLMREWFMHPSGQTAAYEWSFDDVNPPVLAWAALRIYNIDRRVRGVPDRKFLVQIFHKLLLNFTWWVNRKDSEGNNVFEGGFLGLDNIGMFDRNNPLPNGVVLEQSDGTSWMATFCLQMLNIALELAEEEDAYEDVAVKFFEHFFYIAEAMVGDEDQASGLWDEADGFFYDTLSTSDGSRIPLRVRSAVGVIPLFATTTIESSVLDRFPTFKRRVDWFIQHMPELTKSISTMDEVGSGNRRLLSVVDKSQLRRIMERILNTDEFLSDGGVRALSKFHKDNPGCLQVGGQSVGVDYEPGESTSGQFGGNSNWRGPVWMPINFLLIESLQIFDFFYGDELTVEMPTGSNNFCPLDMVAMNLEQRLLGLFLMDKSGHRPVHNGVPYYSSDGPWKDRILFYEYFHGDTGRGVGASHQTGWTALIAKIIDQLYVTAYSQYQPKPTS